MKKRLEEINREIASLMSQMLPIQERLNVLTMEQKELKSRVFIADYQIQKADVEFSAGENKPWFGTVHSFIDWIRKQPRAAKEWTEWNGVIYSTRDLMCGKMPDMPGLAEHLKD